MYQREGLAELWNWKVW